MEEQSQSINFGEWYNSTQGPGMSKTLVAIVGSIISAGAFVLSYKTGVVVDEASVNYFTKHVSETLFAIMYVLFNIRAAYGYVQSKKILQAKLNTLQSRLYASNRSTGSTQGCDCCKHG